MVPLIITFLQWEFLVISTVIFFSHSIYCFRWQPRFFRVCEYGTVAEEMTHPTQNIPKDFKVLDIIFYRQQLTPNLVSTIF